jgi:hypothetical protein
VYYLNKLYKLENFVVYTSDNKGYTAAIGIEYIEVKSTSKNLFCGKIIQQYNPIQRRIFPAQFLQQNYKVTEICTNSCIENNGNLQHQHDYSKKLMLKFVNI